MGKLIDTEELKAKIDEKESRRNEPAWYDGLDTCREIIKDMPAVDTIPVKWLQKKRKYASEGDSLDVGIAEVLDMWEKEQEGV